MNTQFKHWDLVSDGEKLFKKICSLYVCALHNGEGTEYRSS